VHDFSAFRAGQCQAKSPIKEVHHLRVTRHGKMIVLDIRAKRSCTTWCATLPAC
jgi:tRNA pseudouridine38-40 synthase